MVDNQVDKTTGTVQAKVIVENADETLWPGQAVELALTVEIKPKVVSVPASAVLPAQQGMLVWVIGADKKVCRAALSPSSALSARRRSCATACRRASRW